MKRRKFMAVVLSAAMVLGVAGAASYDSNPGLLSAEVSASDSLKVGATTESTSTTTTTETTTESTTEAPKSTTESSTTTTTKAEGSMESTTESSTTTTTEATTTTTTEATTTTTEATTTTTTESTTTTTNAAEKSFQSISVQRLFVKMYKESSNFYVNATAKTKLTYSSSDEKVVKVNSTTGKVAIQGKGTAKIYIKAEGNDTYWPCESYTTIQVLTSKVDQEITASSVNFTYDSNKKVSLGVTAPGKLKYTSSNRDVARVTSKGNLIIKGIGKTTITITAASTEVYNAATKKIVVTIKPKRNAFTAYTSPKSKTVRLKWTKDELVTGYELQMADNANFTGKKTAKAGVNQTTTTIKSGLTSGDTYYFRIRSYYKMSNGKTLNSPWSKVVKVKVK